MSLIWTSRARTKQPQGESGLSLGNPIARGLKFIETGYGRDIKDGRLPVAGTATKTVGPPGRGLTFNGSSDYQRYVNPTGFTVPLSLFIVFTVSSVPNSTVFGLFSSTSDTNGIVALRTVAGSIAVYTYEPTAGYVESAYTAGVPTGVVLTAGASVSAAGGKTAYLAGVPTATTTHAISLSASDRLSIGKIDRASPGDYFPGTIFLAAAWDRVLSAAEFAELNRNPWHLFASEVSPRSFSFPNVLFSKLDETTASDADYITTTTAGSVAELQLGSVTDPGVDTLHSIKLRASGSGSLQVDLVQGSGALLTIWTSKTRTMQPQAPFRVSSEYGNAIVFCGSAPHNNWNGAGAFSLVGSPLQESSLIGVGPRLDGYTQSINLGRKIISAQGTALMLAVNCASLYAFTAPFAQSSTDGGAGIGLGVYGGDFTVAANAAPLNDPGGTGTKMFGGTWGPAGVKAYRNGQLQSTNAYTGAPTAASGPYYMNIGTFQFNGGNVLSHALTPIYFLLTDVVLTADQIRELWINPWQLFAPERRPRHIPAAKPIASRTIPLIATPTDYRRELLPAEAALITNYADLRVRLRGV